MHYQSDLSTWMNAQPADKPEESDQHWSAASNRYPTQAVVLDIAADLAYVHLLSRCACALLEGIPKLEEPEITLYNLELAIQEVSVNIVKHAYAQTSGRIYMTLLLEEQPLRLTITLHDTGRAFDPTRVPLPKLGELQEHGFGLFLVRQLMDEVIYERNSSGNTWKLVKTIPVTE